MRLTRQIAAVSFFLVLLLAGSLLHVFAGYNYDQTSGHTLGNDDAYISFRYAQNLARGHGLVFNPGERVEGYSNLLYTLMIAPALALASPDAAYPFSTVLNLIFIGLAYLVFVHHIHNRYGNVPSLAAGLLLTFCPPLWAAVASGLESTLVLFIQMLIWICLVRISEGGHRQALVTLIAFSALSILARADGFVFPLLAAAYLLMVGKRREALFCGLTVVIPMGALVLWRLVYYGYPLPNTYYAKVSGPLLERVIFALKRLAILSYKSGFIAYITLPGVIILYFINRMREAKQLDFGLIPPEAFLGVGWLLYWIYVGGDIYHERFLLILIPLGISLLLWRFGKILPANWGHLVVLALLILQLIPLVIDARFNYSFNRYDYLVTLGKFLGENHPREILATTAAGKLPYFSELKTIDMHGLNDIHIAHKDVGFFTVPGHNKYDMDYVLSRKPDLIASTITSDLNLLYGLDRNKYTSAGYRLRYIVNVTRQSSGHDIVDTRGLERDAIESLISQGYEFAVLELSREI